MPPYAPDALARTQPRESQGELTPQAFVHHRPDLIRAALDGIPSDAVSHFASSWNALPADAYVKAERPYRFRRYGKFHLSEDGPQQVSHGPFLQAKTVNKLSGGVPRHFAPLDDAVATSLALRAIVGALHDQLPGPHQDINACGIHQIRVTAVPGAEGDPAPEGMHQDGHRFVGQVLVRRDGVHGAQSRIYDLDRRLVYQSQLTAPWESIILDDRRVLHDASPVGVAAGADLAVRDMLLVDFFADPALPAPSPRPLSKGQSHD
ncbi:MULTISPECIES: 2OG-Fe dioxygenase family protein [Streptomyces]|uniref:2OG-Fe dioxygenase family protein n=1 Tax=Streptomyces TaxID=1883 RepID=UPI001F036F06|nr:MULTISPECIES: 2OG-Fe dioxygenase family protein [Streptomyces]